MIRQFIILMLLITVCSSNCAVGESLYTADMLIADWTAKYVDSSYWKTQWLLEANNVAAVVPFEHHIVQQEAIRIAVDTLIRLGYETPENLSKLYKLHWFNTIPIPQKFKDQNDAIDVLIDHWDELYGNSPKYSPAKYGSEMLAFPLPGEADIQQREALQYAVGIAHVLSGYDIVCYYEWLPHVSFDVSPIANRWSISLECETSVPGTYEVFSFLFDAGTCSLESCGWHYTKGD